jgi:hypothetical protein
MRLKLLSALFLILLSSNLILAQGSDPQARSPLNGFEAFIGGQWHLDGSYQTFEWGVGKMSVISKSYFMMDGQSALVSEGMWFWHPGEKKIKGYFIASNMPDPLFEYETTFMDGKMINDLTTYNKAGEPTHYKETMEVTSSDSYEWILIQKGATIMSGTFNKKNY